MTHLLPPCPQASSINPKLVKSPTIQNGRHRTPPTVAENQAINYLQAPGYAGAIELLQCLSQQQDCRIYRPETPRCCIAALQMAASRTHTFHEAAIQIRERNRLQDGLYRAEQSEALCF